MGEWRTLEMISTPESRERMLIELVRVPSVTGTARENDAAVFIFERLSELNYFKKNPSHIEMIPTPLEGDEARPLHAVLARMMADVPTRKTVVFIGHYDVVDVGVYGPLAEYAFDPPELAARMAVEGYDTDEFIFGRGVMDMKCGVAIEMELLRDYDNNRDLLDVNVIVLAVPDEENTNCGMRGAVSRLADLKRSGELEYIAGIDTEPGEPGLPDSPDQLVFLGAIGKLLTAFYCRGVESHVGNYYKGLSAALLSAQIVCAAEGAPVRADPMRGVCPPSWVCLENRVLSEGYSVTVPKRAVAYFNCFITGKTPADILEEMRDVAREAGRRTIDQLTESHKALSRIGYAPKMDVPSEIKVLTFSEIWDMASASFAGGEPALRIFVSDLASALPVSDVRDKGIGILEELIQISGFEAPFVAVGFLPPYIPAKTSLDGLPASEALLRAIDRIIVEACDKYGVTLRKEEFFAGLCDLSYLGFSGDTEDMRRFAKNCPASDKIFRIPFDDMAEINMPVVNLSVCGHDAHRRAERLNRDYSLRILPELIVSAVSAISEEWERR
ncbi:MAG: M20/M25/M40 family metallo-hydrolase [Synergistaceae bacterium]|jgi:arginine utilization protein RocB|nr:M20/M25/M40 family metallo-hydrolase [Synergistaceae bacterium]